MEFNTLSVFNSCINLSDKKATTFKQEEAKCTVIDRSRIAGFGIDVESFDISIHEDSRDVFDSPFGSKRPLIWEKSSKEYKLEFPKLKHRKTRIGIGNDEEQDLEPFDKIQKVTFPELLEDTTKDISQTLGASMLPSFSVRSDPVRRINSETLIDLILGKYSHLYNSYTILDCRFPYEYDGGHINGSTNVPNKRILESLLRFDHPPKRSVLIFHCEFSIKRAPSYAMYLRSLDRKFNLLNYPHLSYPEIYVLSGGYSKFFSSNVTHCSSPVYIPMNHSSYSSDCKLMLDSFTTQFSLKRSRSCPEPYQSPTSRHKRIKSKSISLH
ncbi:M-phase inducer phosphatase [Zancudomyces culisetae]|uniref:M-phase inducer phosphatase n=1 Tax=Zancudomyces culisetae TaxID=1213189 RepID=A0A1R1PHW3_ZANCU|nr:M-phase inducer phosphatase [Zancudomyces culisetae]|eukprot:OMH80570.1 M-phase inducer phosphatase [Zancudomyces culisetae]